MMISGCSLTAYWVGNYIADIMFQSIGAIAAVIAIKVFDVDVPYAWVLLILVVLANPAFVYFFSFFFEKDDAGSLSVKLLYMLFGVIAPLAVSILQFVEKTKDVGNVLRWFFYPFPIYSLANGYLSISQRSLIQLVN